MANNPTLLKMPLAADGEKTTIPETTGSTTGEFSQQYGFQAINALPLQAGGIAPKREDFNGAFHLLGGVAYYTQKGWTFLYDSTQAYFAGCLVIDPTDGKRYECIVDVSAGGTAPHDDTDGTYWKVYSLGDMAGKANTSLDNLTEAGKSFFFPSDTLVNLNSIIQNSGDTYVAPANGFGYYVCNGDGQVGDAAIRSHPASNPDAFLLASRVLTWGTTDLYIPVKKGDILEFTWDAHANPANAWFIYAQGEV